jgi:hypothetical protein
MPAMTRSFQRATLTVVWLLIAAVVSIGAAGLVAAMANQPGTAARAELTSETDAKAAAGLDASLAELALLAKDVDRLGELGRGALTALVASDFTTLDSAVADGATLARAIDTRSARIQEALRLLPGTGPTEALAWSPETIQRRDLALAAVTATGGLEIAWNRLAAGSTVANRLTVLLTSHDTTAGKAAASGRDGKYAAALKTLAEAQAMLDDAKGLRDALANTVDVTTLTQWIDRNTEYDAALARLYKATVAAKGRITDELKAAFTAERRAHDLLPSNTSGLVIILAEIGRGGLNQAVIGIEETRAMLQAAVDRLSAPSSPEPDASDGPEPGASDGPEPSATGG